MKKLIFFFLLPALIPIACSNGDEDNNVNPGVTPEGTWKVTYFFDKDHEETSDFSGYSFEFQNGGAFVA
jgi:hypothetical protein